MGFLEDLIKTVQEAEIERRRAAGLPVPPGRRQQAQIVRRERPPPPVSVADEPPAPPPRAPARDEGPPPPAHTSVPNAFAQLLRQPRTVRTALILSELLQPPLALRRGLLHQRRMRP